MSELVGYKLLNSAGETVKEFGGTWGQRPGIPNPLFLPNGDSVGAPALDTELSGGFRLVEWWMDQPFVNSTTINQERDRRIFGGFVFAGKTFQSSADDYANISGAALLATVAMQAGAGTGNLRWADPDADFGWIAADNTILMMDAPTTIAFGVAAAAHKRHLIFRARELKDQTPDINILADEVWS